MQSFGKILSALVKGVGFVLGIVLVLALVLLGVLGFTNFGARLVTDRVASALSNRDMTIAIENPGALLTGGLRASRILLSDTRGVFAEIDGLSIDWNPTALLTARFHATNLEAASIAYLRPPVRTLPAAPKQDGAGFSLPVRVTVDHISLPDIRLAEAVTGRAFTLAGQGSVNADSNGGNAIFQLNRREVPDAKLTADLAYVPSENRLRLNAELSEPKGGLLAGFLALPGEPAVKIDLQGEGPISDWKGRLQAALDGQQRAALDAYHTITADNLHHLNLKGGGDVSALLPAAFRPLFAGQTNIDVATAFDDKGRIDIQTGNIATGSVVIAASGTLDPHGKNSLNANVLGTAGPVDFRWPLADGEARMMISGLNLALTGDAKASRLNANLSLESASLPQADIGNTKLTAKSDNFNLASRSGTVQLRLVSGDADFKNADVNRLLQGAINLGSTLQISADAIGFNGTTLDTGTSHAKINGSYQQTTGGLTGNINLAVDPAGLPQAIASRLSAPLTLEAQVSGIVPSKINLSNVKLTSDLLEASGNLSLNDQVLDAVLSGKLTDLGKLMANTKGELLYNINAKGQLANLAVTGNLKADRLDMVGKPVTGLQIDLDGTLGANSSNARLTAKGAIDNQPIAINGAGALTNGLVSLPEFDATVGPDRLSGRLALDQAYLPSGALSFDLPDIALIAALAGQDAGGDLKGSIDIANAQGKIKLDVKAAGGGLNSGPIGIKRPDVALNVSDLKAFAATGTIKADEVAIPASRLVDPVVTLNQTGSRTNFDLEATYDDAPLAASGSAEIGSETRVTLDRFSGRPRGIPVDLATPAHAVLGGDGLRLDRFTLRTGEGSVDIAGTAGKALDFHADIAKLPASLADNFVRDLAAEGTISGTADITGQPAAPIGDFKLSWQNAATSQTRQAGLGPLAVNADGKLAGERLVFATSAVSGRTVSLKANGTYDISGQNAGTIVADADIVNLPAELANGFVANLEAEGAISGTIKTNGKLPSPVVDFNLAWKDAATAQTRQAKLAGIALATTGKLENNVLAFNAKAGADGGLSLTADGTYALSGASAQALELNGALVNVPAALANPYVPSLDAAGLISGTVRASGRLPRPNADFDLTWTNLATQQTRTAQLGKAVLTAKGRFAENKLNTDAALAMAAGGGLKATAEVQLDGNAIQTLNVDAALDRIPAALANPFVPSLDAAGLISGTVRASGTLPRPNADFDLTWVDLATQQTRTAQLGDATLTAKGRFADDRLNADAALAIAGGAGVKATADLVLDGNAVKTVNVDAALDRVPAALANPFVPSLDAAGLISGTVRASGTLPRPNADFDLTWTDLATQQTRTAQLGDATLTAKGRFADNRLNADAALALAGGGGLKATGNAEIEGTALHAMTVDATLDRLPAALANGFVQHLDAAGAVSGSLKASGTLQQPATNFDLTWSGAATSHTRAAHLSPIEAKAKGDLTNGQLRFDANATDGSATRLQAAGTAQVEGTVVRDINANARLDEVPASLVNAFHPDLDASGTVSATAVVAGALPRPAVDFTVDWKDASTAQTKQAGLSVLALKAKGKFADDAVAFDADLSDLQRNLLKADGAISLVGTAIGDLRINADIAGLPASIANGFVPGLGAEGVITGSARTSGPPEDPAVDFNLDWKDAATSQTKQAGLKALGVTAGGKLEKGSLAFKADIAGDGLAINGNGNATIAGTQVKDITADAIIQNLPASLANGFVPDLDAAGVISGKVSAKGMLPVPDVDFTLNWKDAGTRQTKAARLGALAADATGKITNGKLDFDATLSGSGVSLKSDGSYGLTGEAAKSLDLRADLINIPASLANGFVPDLDAAGTITGKVTAAGKLPIPNATFDLNWKNATTRQTKAAGIGALGAQANGKLTDGKLDFNAALSGSGVSLKTDGSYVLTGNAAQSLDIRADLANIPAGIANAFVPGLGAEGAISGNAAAKGKLLAPNADFKLNWKNAATSQTKGAGLAPFSISADGKVADSKLNFNTTLAGQAGLTLKGGGSVGITGQRALDLRFNGSLPFAVLGTQLAAQGLSATGTARVDLQVGGTAASPLINGNVSTSGSKLVDVRRNLALNNIQATIDFTGKQASITRLSAQFASGGSISAGGTIGIDPASGFPADINVKLNRAVYVDGTLIVAIVDGTLGLKGPVLSNPTLSGELKLGKTSITVPAKLPSSLQKVKIKHVNAPPAVRRQLKDTTPAAPSSKSSTINLDITLDAPSEIFVRGRGIDAELGGRIGIKGTAAAPQVTGGFTMRRGRLTILNRRLDFTDKSRITFAGDLTPALALEASSSSGSTTLTVDVAGVATDPDITFSSSPALPQDEVLAQLIFGQSMSKLSPVQIAQLADAVSQLAGGRSTSLFEGLRNQLGVDDLDVSTDAQGRTSVSVGRYLNERTYFELQQSEEGPKAVINLDVGRGVKLRAGAGGSGSGEAGVVYEREY